MRRLDAESSKASKRSRASERGMGGQASEAHSQVNRTAVFGTVLALSGLGRPRKTFDRNRLTALLARLNDAAKSRVLTLQEYFVLAGKSLRFIFARPFYAQDVVQQMDEIGVKSLGIVLLTGLFTGMVLALQSSVQLKTFGATMYIGNLVSASMIRELGPVLAGLMVAGRVGSGIAAQLGSMRVTEQIDALNTLGTDPIKKLVTPRVLAALIMLPVLTVINDFVGIIGGNVIAAFVIGLPTSQYWRTVWDQIAADGFTMRYVPNDFVQGLSKPFVFGGLISITACYFGLGTTGGTEGVGVSTTRTVVTSSILILIVDYFITQLLLSVLSYGT
jgi:phospholipid/cholesterol/gamma-HCH transport system permease protein